MKKKCISELLGLLVYRVIKRSSHEPMHFSHVVMKRRFTVKSVHLVAVWHWKDAPKDTACVICDNPFEMTCVQCDKPGNQCPPGYGECGHVFHLHCIGRWLNRAGAQSEESSTCPICRSQWKFVTEKIESTAGTNKERMEAVSHDCENNGSL